MRITRQFGFDMGHCLPDHDGGCYRPHGHRYTLEVTIDGDVRVSGVDRGMVMDFARLKRIVEDRVIDYFDHKFAMSRDDPRLRGAITVFGDNTNPIVVCDGPPTAEYLAVLIGAWLREELPVVEVTLWETPTCRATMRYEA